MSNFDKLKLIPNVSITGGTNKYGPIKVKKEKSISGAAYKELKPEMQLGIRRLRGIIDSLSEETKNLGVELDKVAEGVLEIIKKDVESINQTIAKGVVGGIKSFSRGLAESIVLGKDLENTMK